MGIFDDTIGFFFFRDEFLVATGSDLLIENDGFNLAIAGVIPKLNISNRAGFPFWRLVSGQQILHFF